MCGALLYALKITHNPAKPPGKGELALNHTQHQEAVKKAVKPRFRGQGRLNSKTTPQYPDSAEREYKRIANGYMRLLNETLAENLPEIMDAYKLHLHGDSRYDDARDLEDMVRRVFQKIAQQLEQKLARYGLADMIGKVSKLTKNTSLREWKKAVHETLGIDLLSDYYSGAFYESAIRRWVDENVLRIQSIPKDTLGEMQEIILSGFRKGETITSITKEIQNSYKVSRNRAKMIARDQVATLNSQITKMQQEDAGCKYYRWSDSRDSRVRDCHRALNGKVFSWDDPPEMWYNTKSRGRVNTGRRCHPGEDICCRCIAIPVFDIDTIDVPIKESTHQKGMK